MHGYQYLMNRFKEEKKQDDKRLIFEIIKGLDKPVTSSEIYEYIKRQKKQKIKNQVEEQIEGKNSTFLEQLEKKLRRKEGVSLRTVQRRLDDLKKEGIITEQKQYYTVSNIKNPEVKIHARDFGETLLFSIMRDIKPSNKISERDLEQLINAFGLYIVYCFIEGARTLVDKNENKISISPQIKDQLTSHWIENVINPMEMFYYFLNFAQYRLDDLVRQIKDRKASRDLGESYSIIQDAKILLNNLSIEKSRKFRLHSKSHERKHSDIINLENPQYEIDLHNAESLKKLLKKKYGSLFNQLEDAFNQFEIKNKEGNLSTK